jgi:hypothetical protein
VRVSTLWLLLVWPAALILLEIKERHNAFNYGRVVVRRKIPHTINRIKYHEYSFQDRLQSTAGVVSNITVKVLSRLGISASPLLPTSWISIQPYHHTTRRVWRTLHWIICWHPLETSNYSTIQRRLYNIQRPNYPDYLTWDFWFTRRWILRLWCSLLRHCAVLRLFIIILDLPAVLVTA